MSDRPEPEELSTGLPRLLPQTWKGLYWFILGAFALWVVLLFALTQAYSS